MTYLRNMTDGDMNTDNYCTREAAQKLIDNGIVLETDFVWFRSIVGWTILRSKETDTICEELFPAPSPAEVWRELKDESICIVNNSTGVTATIADINYYDFTTTNTNLTDALIALLIWVRKSHEPKSNL